MAVRILVIGEQIVPRTVPARPPNQRVAVDAEKIAGGLQVAPVPQLKGDVVHPHLLGIKQVDRVVVRPTAQEREDVAEPIGHPKAEHIAIEVRNLLHIDAIEGDVTELERRNAAVVLRWRLRQLALAKY